MRYLPTTSCFNIRFKRWTRKTYAVFASMGKAVTIGMLKTHMATRIQWDSLRKDASLNQLYEHALEEPTVDDSLPNELLEQLNIIPLHSTATAIPAVEQYYLQFTPINGRISARHYCDRCLFLINLQYSFKIFSR